MSLPVLSPVPITEYNYLPVSFSLDYLGDVEEETNTFMFRYSCQQFLE
jgi:hypothetical protein